MKLPQLTLRDLFLLVALVALGCGWWADRSQIRQREARVKEQEAVVWKNGISLSRLMDRVWEMREDHPEIKKALDELQRKLEEDPIDPIERIQFDPAGSD